MLDDVYYTKTRDTISGDTINRWRKDIISDIAHFNRFDISLYFYYFVLCFDKQYN